MTLANAFALAFIALAVIGLVAAAWAETRRRGR